MRNHLAVLLVLCVVAVPAVAAAADCHRAFRSADPIITSISLQTAVYGDFNEDGRTDVVLTLQPGVRVVALNRGDVFQPLARETIITPPPQSELLDFGPVAAADANGDGHLDLIYRSGTRIYVAPGKGDGTFGALIESTLSLDISNSRLVDWNHDGRPDFINVNSFGAGPVTFIAGKPDGTFAIAGSATFTGTSSYQSIGMVTGDFDGDGNYDVALIATDLSHQRQTIVRVLWNDGSGHFTETQQYIEVPHNLQPLDIDGDGAEELVSIDRGNLVALSLRSRQASVKQFPVLPADVSMPINNGVAIDVNRDGRRDIVFPSGTEIGVILAGRGGEFRGAQFYEMRGSGLAVVDVNGDGVPDFASTYGHDGVVVLDGRSLAAGMPNADRVYPVGLAFPAVAVADANGDGTPDLIAAAVMGDGLHVTVLPGTGGGVFDPVGTTFIGAAHVSGTPLLGDFDGDGTLDVAVNGTNADNTPAKPLVFFDSSAGLTATPLVLNADAVLGTVKIGASSAPAIVASSGDDIQLITISAGRSASNATVYHRPAGARISVASSTGGAEPAFVVSGTNDLRVVAHRNGEWRETAVTDWRFADVIGATAADFDHDGRTDLALWSDTRVEKLLQQADGSYKTTDVTDLPNVFISDVRAVDVDGDGWADLVVSGRSNVGEPGTVGVFRNVGGNFETYATTMTQSSPSTAIVADVDGDGAPDLLLASTYGAGIEVLRNDCTTPRIRYAVLPAAPPEGTTATVVIHALSTNGFSVGRITISENGKVLVTEDPNPGDLATFAWTTPVLTPGTHTYHVVYNDQYAGPSSVDIVVTSHPNARRRAAGR